MNTNFALALSFTAIFSFVVGCSSAEVEPIGGSTSGTPSVTSSSGGGSGGGGTGGGGGSAPIACASAPLCGGIYLPSSCNASGSGSGSGSGGGGGAPNPTLVTEMRCALQKLRDHEVGYVSLFVESTFHTGCGVRTEIVSFGDGSASVQQIQWADLGVAPGTPERVKLESVAYFDACLAGSDDKLAECVMAMTTKTAVAGPTCPCRGVPGAQDGQCESPF
jgi:hypothetical protein